MTTAWEVISEWLAMANNANRHNLTMTLVDNPMLLALLAVVVTNRRLRQHSLLLQVAAAEEAEDSRRSRERVFK